MANAPQEGLPVIRVVAKELLCGETYASFELLVQVDRPRLVKATTAALIAFRLSCIEMGIWDEVAFGAVSRDGYVKDVTDDKDKE